MNNCSHPMSPNEEEFLRFVLDGEPLSPATLEHMEHCSCCQKQRTTYQQLNSYVLKNVYRHICPSPTLLNYYCMLDLSEEENLYIEKHLQECPLCAQEVRDIQQVLADFEPFPEETPVSSSLTSSQQRAANPR